MLDLIRKAIGLDAAGAAPGASRELSNELLAAVLLLEAAHSDYHCTKEEQEHVIGTIRAMYPIPEKYMDELMELAHAERSEAVDLHRFTRFANESMSREEKLELIEGVWRIILADGRIDKYEEHFARKLCDLLWLEHRDFIAAKMKVKGD